MTREPMPPENVSELYGRSRGRCEHPDGCPDMATVIHHRRGRGPGRHAVELLAHLCEKHHLIVHARPEESRANGMMVSRHDPVKPHVRDAS